MDFEIIRNYCLQKPGSSEDLPFDEDTLVIRAASKIFILLPLDTPDRINLKCDPELAIELREKHSAVQPGYHMNKKHWNTVFINEDVNKKELFKMIDHSYDLVYDKLTKKEKESIKGK
jgi:predicted DNA-binding protein (MmcQ/YjbR family)